MTVPVVVPTPHRVDATRTTEIELFSLAGHDGHLREVNASFARLLGLAPDELNGRSLLELVHPDDLAHIVAGLGALEAGAAEVLLENRFLLVDGTAVHLQWVARPVPGTELWWAAGRNTTEFHRALSQRHDLRARLELAIGQVTAAMWELDLRGGRFTWEPQAAEVLGVAADGVPSGIAGLVEQVHPDDSAALREAFAELPVQGVVEVAVRVGGDGDLRHLSVRGKVLDRDRRGRPVRAVGLVLDVTAEKAMEEQMLRMVMRDALTGVPNRRAFDQALRTEWRRCTRSGLPLSVMMIDVDNFKRFNDTFGHLVGDEALCSVARSLSGAVDRAGDALARFGGEEFAVVLPGTAEPGARVLADRLCEAVRGASVRQAPGWTLTVSIGIASCVPAEASSLRAAGLLGRADRALYAAKAAGKDRATGYYDRPVQQVASPLSGPNP